MTHPPDAEDSTDSRPEQDLSSLPREGEPEQGTDATAHPLGSEGEDRAERGDDAARGHMSGEDTGGERRASAVRPSPLEPSAHTAKPSLPWRPSDTGHGLGSGSSTIDVLSEEGLEQLARTLAGIRAEDAVFVTRCSWCHRFEVDDWCDAATAAERLRDRDPELVPTITHGICDTCAAGFEDAL